MKHGVADGNESAETFDPFMNLKNNELEVIGIELNNIGATWLH